MRYLVALLTLFLSLRPALAEGDRSADGERVLRLLLNGRSSRITEADPAKWTSETWEKSGPTKDEWQKAISSWSTDPEVQGRAAAGLACRDRYFKGVLEEALKELGACKDPARQGMVRDYVAFMEAQKSVRLGKPNQI